MTFKTETTDPDAERVASLAKQALTNPEALAALAAAARFVLAWADDIDHDVQYAADHVTDRHPSATIEAIQATDRNAVQFHTELDELLELLLKGDE